MDSLYIDAAGANTAYDSNEELYELPVPPADVEYPSRQALIRGLQAFAKPHGYAFTTYRSKPYEKGPHIGKIRKLWLRCDRGAKYRSPEGRRRRHGTSRARECPFKIIALLNPVA